MDALQIERRQFDADRPGPHLLVTGGVHGDEFEPMAAVRRLIRQFDGDDPELRLACGRLTLVPVVNEAAFRRGTRTADDGLDLARVCPGRADGSITERTAHTLSQLIRSADYYIDLHAGGLEFSVLPMVGYTLHSDANVLESQRRMARAFSLPIVWGTSAALEGRSLSVARDAGVPAIYAEYHGSSLCDSRGVDAYVTGCLNVVSLLGMLDRAWTPSEPELIVEDLRPGSGHMQVCNPSPITGFFTPAVTLGERISRTDLIGTVCDPLGSITHEVRSQSDGIVLVVRTFSRVRVDESVGVILETAVSS
jgi:predicted deacylase